MNKNRTFAMIKPSSVRDNHIGGIIEMIEKDGFKLIASKLTKLTLKEAEDFYSIHNKRPFYDDLCKFMSSGPIVAMVLEKKDAVTSFRNLIGATNPTDAAEGTIRKRFAKSIDENAIHGSDSNENAEIEIGFFFSKREIFMR